MMELRLRLQSCLIPTWGQSRRQKAVASRGSGRAQQEGWETVNHFGGYWRTKPDAFDQELVIEMFESGVCSVESRFPM